MSQDKAIKFSIIIPVYKVEEYLEQCVESVLAQRFFDSSGENA